MSLRERRRAKRTQLPVLRYLTSLTTHHTHFFVSVRDRNVFCSFVRRLIAHSKLRSLVLSPQRLSRFDGTLSASYNALLAHLCAKHGSWLEVVDAPYFYLGRTAFVDLVRACPHLQKLGIMVYKKTIVRPTVTVAPFSAVSDVAPQRQSVTEVHQARALRSLCFTETPWRKHGVGQEGLYETEANQMFAAAPRLTEWIVNGHTYQAGLSMILIALARELSAELRTVPADQ
jgi:hypothetical protein